MTPAEQHSVKADTEYVVLRQQAGTWQQIGFFTTRDPADAVKQAYNKLDGQPHEGDVGGSFVAVAARYWNPVAVRPQVVTTLTLEQVKS